MAQRIDGIALGSIAVGAALTYAGIRGKSVPSLIQGFIQGNAPSSATAANAITGTSASSATSGASSAPAAPVNVSGNVATGKLLAAGYGWGSGAEWNALYDLWERESGWSNTAKNASSGAYGIPQALPPTKMPAAAQESGGSSPTAQIQWGLSYIAQRYGTPSAAWAHEEANGWY